MLNGKRIAILVAEGFEQSEMVEPRKALEQSGAQTEIVSPAQDEVQGWKHFDKGDRFQVDVQVEDADANDYDALLLPGGVANPDQLRTDPKAVRFVKRFFDAGKTDLANAGAKWVDEEVVVDRNLVSSRKPDDIPAFSRKLIEMIGEGTQRRPASTQRIEGGHHGRQHTGS